MVMDAEGWEKLVALQACQPELLADQDFDPAACLTARADVMAAERWPSWERRNVTVEEFEPLDRHCSYEDEDGTVHEYYDNARYFRFEGYYREAR